ncbi:hypothetical protein JMUB7545_27770 [Staphylococcus aureus]
MYKRQRQNYSFGGYMIVSMNSFLEMRRLKLSAREREAVSYTHLTLPTTERV